MTLPIIAEIFRPNLSDKRPVIKAAMIPPRPAAPITFNTQTDQYAIMSQNHLYIAPKWTC